jgi:hypothetical protein
MPESYTAMMATSPVGWVSAVQLWQFEMYGRHHRTRCSFECVRNLKPCFDEVDSWFYGGPAPQEWGHL